MRNFLSSIIILLLILSPFLSLKNTEKTVLTSAKPLEYEIFVDADECKLYLLLDNKIEKVYSCSGGKWSTPSPVGTWKITEKAKWGEGFGGSWLGLNVPWGKFRNTWYFAGKFSWLGKLSWLYKNG